MATIGTGDTHLQPGGPTGQNLPYGGLYSKSAPWEWPTPGCDIIPPLPDLISHSLHSLPAIFVVYTDYSSKFLELSTLCLLSRVYPGRDWKIAIASTVSRTVSKAPSPIL